MADALDPDFVTPLVTYLCSEKCEVTHEIFDVGGGRYARIFIGLAKGWLAPKGKKPKAEDILDQIDVIRDARELHHSAEHRRRDQGDRRSAQEPAVGDPAMAIDPNKARGARLPDGKASYRRTT